MELTDKLVEGISSRLFSAKSRVTEGVLNALPQPKGFSSFVKLVQRR